MSDPEIVIFYIETKGPGPPYQVSFHPNGTRLRSVHVTNHENVKFTMNVEWFIVIDTEEAYNSHQEGLSAKEGPDEPIVEVLLWDRYDRLEEIRVPCEVKLVPGVL